MRNSAADLGSLELIHAVGGCLGKHVAFGSMAPALELSADVPACGLGLSCAGGQGEGLEVHKVVVGVGVVGLDIEVGQCGLGALGVEGECAACGSDGDVCVGAVALALCFHFNEESDGGGLVELDCEGEVLAVGFVPAYILAVFGEQFDAAVLALVDDCGGIEVGACHVDAPVGGSDEALLLCAVFLDEEHLVDGDCGVGHGALYLKVFDYAFYVGVFGEIALDLAGAFGDGQIAGAFVGVFNLYLPAGSSVAVFHAVALVVGYVEIVGYEFVFAVLRGAGHGHVLEGEGGVPSVFGLELLSGSSCCRCHGGSSHGAKE